MNNGTFFIFPVGLLALPIEEKDRLNRICNYALHRAGVGANAEQIDDIRIQTYIQEHSLVGYTRKPEQNQILRGAIICGVNLGNLSSSLKLVADSDKYIRQQEAKHGRDALVFVSSKLFFACRDHDDPPYREFSTLCAINSICGFKKTPILIRRCMIIARQLGFKTPKIMAAELGKPNSPKPMTVQQLRDTLDRLEAGKLIARCQASRTCVYFSSWLDGEALREEVKKNWASKGWVISSREKDRSTIASTEKNHLKREEPLKKEFAEKNQAGTKREPSRNQARTKQEPSEEPLKEVSLNKCLLRSVSKEVCEMRAREVQIQPAEKNEFSKPTLEQVQEYARQLFNEDPERSAFAALCAESWFQRHGEDPNWAERSWTFSLGKEVIAAVEEAKP